MDAMPFKLQLHFSLPCKQHTRIPRFLADWEHILSFPHCSWQPGSHVASRIFNLTRLFLSGSGREQGSCQFESGAHTWQSWADRRAGGRCRVPAIHGPSWGSLSPSPTELRCLQAILLSEGPFTIRPADLLLTLIQLVIQFLKFYFKAFISLPIFFFQSCSWECPILKFSRF